MLVGCILFKADLNSMNRQKYIWRPYVLTVKPELHVCKRQSIKTSTFSIISHLFKCYIDLTLVFSKPSFTGVVVTYHVHVNNVGLVCEVYSARNRTIGLCSALFVSTTQKVGLIVKFYTGIYSYLWIHASFNVIQATKHHIAFTL